MRLPINLLAMLALSVGAHAATLSFQIVGDDPGAWRQILSSIGLTEGPASAVKTNSVVVVPNGVTAPEANWKQRVEDGTILVLEGDSALAQSFGFHPTAARVTVRSVEDARAPKLRMVWEKALDLPVFEVPSTARVFARERWQGSALMAGFRLGSGAVLWMAAPPGPHGYERFPYVPQALMELGMEPRFRSSNMWAFFDSSYRARVDLDYFAARWRASGISALHVAAWHYWERDPQSDEYLRKLIDACHRNAIQVYAWIEMPHVSEKFWAEHPEWREKTAVLQDAQLDWRKLMNLTNRQAFAAASANMRDLVERFDWDGVNLAELYFESLEGHANPARFTPMNDDVRSEFRAKAGFDPHDLFDSASPRYFDKNSEGLKQFLEFRADLARRQQAEWIGEVDEIRKKKPYLDLTLTHIDDRFDTTMRDKLGADASRVLPLLAEHDFTFLIEDPATVWNLGPQRYPQIAARYQPLTERQDKLAIDVNIVERYQDVYPTKVQTGAELFQLVHLASLAFPRIALYFENSITPTDLPLLTAAASTVEKVEQVGPKLVVDSRRGTGVAWTGPALVDGHLWPIANSSTVWLPAGKHSIGSAPANAPILLEDFNGEIKSAGASAKSVDFSYQSSARAYAVVGTKPGKIEIDGAPAVLEWNGNVLTLPRGQHLVTLTQ
jgi:hypothetical protein